MDHTSLDQTITIQRLEEFTCLGTTPTFTRKNEERLSILLILKGGGKCIYNGEAIALRDQEIYTGVAGCFQRLDIDNGTAGYLLTINTLRLETGLDNIAVLFKGLSAGGRSCLRLNTETCEEMDWLMRRIIKKDQAQERSSVEFVNKYISLLLLHLQSELHHELVFVSMNRKGALLKGFFGLLEEDYMTGRTVDYYADKLCVTPKHLTNVIKLGSGFPTLYHINQRIILEAKRMAQTSGASLKEIAGELGYEDVATFSKLFKRVSGENFSTYKCNLKYAFTSHTQNCRR